MIILAVTLLAFLALVRGHGYMTDPPNRASMWRYGYHTPINYDDNQFFCGGYSVQHDTYGSKCGLCGDSYGVPRPRPNENGGTYGTGIVTRRYKRGQEIQVIVYVTANHAGSFQFSICKLSRPSQLEEEICFAKDVLQLADGSGKRYKLLKFTPGNFSINLRLPKSLTCKQCVLRWHYDTGNSWGTCIDGSGALGCGKQENFRSCADIAIDP